MPTRYTQDFMLSLKRLIRKKHIPKRENEIDSLRLRVARMSESGAGVSQVDIERYLGNNDLLPINYFERGLLAASAVCRLNVPQPVGLANRGTGFLITPPPPDNQQPCHRFARGCQGRYCRILL